MFQIKKTGFLIGSLILFYTGFSQNWQTKTDIPIELAFPVVVELKGHIHVIGGGGPSGASNLHLRYKPESNRWDTLAPVPFLAQQPAGAVVNGKIHFCGGGYPNSGTRLNKHYFYDADSLKWFQAENLPVATAIHKAVAFDNKLYILSGQPDKLLCEYYDPVSKTWTQKNSLPDQNFWYGVIVSTSSSIYRFGGGGFMTPTTAAHSYDKANDSWTSLPDLPLALHAPAGTVLNDSLIFISGGYGQGITYDKTYIYHTVKKKYYPSDPLPFGNNYHSMVTVNGCVFSAGGDNAAVTGAGVALVSICSPKYKWAVSTKNLSAQKPFTVHKTPEKIAFSFNESQAYQFFEVDVLDFLGKKIKSNFREDGTGNIEIFATDFSSGNYLIVLKEGKNVYVEKWYVSR